MSFTETLSSYSLVILFPLFLLALASFLPIKRWRTRIPVYASVMVIGAVAFLLLRPGDSSVGSTAEANEIISAGQPVFVEFFSNTCAMCLASQPAV